MVRYSFTVGFFHPLLPAGLSRRFRTGTQPRFPAAAADRLRQPLDIPVPSIYIPQHPVNVPLQGGCPQRPPTVDFPVNGNSSLSHASHRKGSVHHHGWPLQVSPKRPVSVFSPPEFGSSGTRTQSTKPLYNQQLPAISMFRIFRSTDS